MNTGIYEALTSVSHTRHRGTVTRLIPLAILAALFGGGCAANAGKSEPIELQGRGQEFTSNAVVVTWNQIASDAAVTHDGFQDFAVNLRAITMMHIAVHDALNSIKPNYARYGFAGARKPRAHPTAAAAQAAHDVLVNAYPAQQATFDSELATSLAGVTDGESQDAGVMLGKDAAAAIVSERNSDGWDAEGSYVPNQHQRPGDYQFVPPFDFAFRPAFGDAKPFGIDDATEFRGPPPPDLSSSHYATAYDEAKAFGMSTGSSRSEDQSHEARWWYEFAEIGWNRIANQLVRERDVGLYAAARLLALVNMGVADAYVAVWNSKRFYDRWRPYTAIRAAEVDGNDRTSADAAWEPFCVTPPTWEYPSAHAMQSAAAAEMLATALGTDDISFTATSTTAPPELPEQSFTSLERAAAEAADSRVMCGIHFRYATDAGLAQGQALAESIVRRHLRAD